MDFFLHAHLIYKGRCPAGDCHGQMNATNYEKWEAKKLLTFNLHSKTRMIWFGRKGIVSDETMSKNDLPVNFSTEAQRDINKIDRILANHGHAVRLPPYV